jgi:hypothetical protein
MHLCSEPQPSTATCRCRAASWRATGFKRHAEFSRHIRTSSKVVLSPVPFRPTKIWAHLSPLEIYIFSLCFLWNCLLYCLWVLSCILGSATIEVFSCGTLKVALGCSSGNYIAFTKLVTLGKYVRWATGPECSLISKRTLCRRRLNRRLVLPPL